MVSMSQQKYPRTKKSYIECLLVSLSCCGVINIPMLIKSEYFSKTPLSENNVEIWIVGIIISTIVLGTIFFFSRVKTND